MIHGRRLFPGCAGLGSEGGPRYETAIAQGDNYFERRQSQWTDSTTGYGAGPNLFEGISKVRYKPTQPLLSPEDAALLLDHFWVSAGRAYGFRFKDPTDWSTHPTGSEPPNIYNLTHYVPLRVQLGTERTWQLQRTYNLGDVNDGTFIRDITRPMRASIDPDHVSAMYPLAGPVSSTTGLPIWFDGIDYGTDYDTGQIRIYSHQPTPTPGGQILWCGTYHIPGNFATDVFYARFESGNDRVSIERLEVLEHAPDLHRGEGESYHGGWYQITSTLLDEWQPTTWTTLQHYYLTPGFAHFQELKDFPPGSVVFMPDPQSAGNWPLGGPYVKLWNNGANPVLIVDHTGATCQQIQSGLQPDDAVEIYLLDPAATAGPGSQWGFF